MKSKVIAFFASTIFFGCAASGPQMVNGDKRIWLRNDQSSPFDISYYSNSEVQSNEKIRSSIEKLGTDSTNGSGFVIIKAQEWKKDKGVFSVTRIVSVDPANKTIIDDMNDAKSISQYSKFIDQGDWIDKTYAFKVKQGYDSVFVRVYGNVTGLFGLSAKAEYSPLLMIYPKSNK